MPPSDEGGGAVGDGGRESHSPINQNLKVKLGFVEPSHPSSTGAPPEGEPNDSLPPPGEVARVCVTERVTDKSKFECQIGVYGVKNTQNVIGSLVQRKLARKRLRDCHTPLFTTFPPPGKAHARRVVCRG